MGPRPAGGGFHHRGGGHHPRRFHSGGDWGGRGWGYGYPYGYPYYNTSYIYEEAPSYWIRTRFQGREWTDDLGYSWEDARRVAAIRAAKRPPLSQTDAISIILTSGEPVCAYTASGGRWVSSCPETFLAGLGAALGFGAETCPAGQVSALTWPWDPPRCRNMTDAEKAEAAKAAAAKAATQCPPGQEVRWLPWPPSCQPSLPMKTGVTEAELQSLTKQGFTASELECAAKWQTHVWNAVTKTCNPKPVVGGGYVAPKPAPAPAPPVTTYVPPTSYTGKATLFGLPKTAVYVGVGSLAILGLAIFAKKKKLGAAAAA